MFGELKVGHLYRALCQEAECRSTLGALHIPCVSGRVIFVCHLCGTVNEFRNGTDGFEVKVLGKVKVSGGRARHASMG